MKYLVLLRHAKSAHNDASLLDHERPLNARGNRDAPQMALRLRPFLTHVDTVWVSSAVRTQATWALMQPLLGEQPLQVRTEPELYEASATKLLYLLAAQADPATGILLVGHQPGVSDLAAALTGKPWLDFPTCAFAVLELSLLLWNEIAAGVASCTSFHYPKQTVGS